MFVVLFEVQPRQERWSDYLDLAKFLKPKLEAIDGFIDNERFASQRTPRQPTGGRCSPSLPGGTKNRWCAGVPKATITASRSRAAAACSRIITCGSAK